MVNGPGLGLPPYDDEPEDQVVRRRRFEEAHPGIVIREPSYSSGRQDWTAHREGDSTRPITSAWELKELLDELEVLEGWPKRKEAGR